MGILFVGIPFLIFVFGMFFIDSVKAKNTFKDKVAALKNYAGMSYREGDDTPRPKRDILTFIVIEPFIFYPSDKTLKVQHFIPGTILSGRVSDKDFNTWGINPNFVTMENLGIVSAVVYPDGSAGIPLSKCSPVSKDFIEKYKRYKVIKAIDAGSGFLLDSNESATITMQSLCPKVGDIIRGVVEDKFIYNTNAKGLSFVISQGVAKIGHYSSLFIPIESLEEVIPPLIQY